MVHINLVKNANQVTAQINLRFLNGVVYFVPSQISVPIAIDFPKNPTQIFSVLRNSDLRCDKAQK